MADEDPLKNLLPPEPTEKEPQRDLRIARRRELLDHIDYLLRPPAQFHRDLEKAIELAAEGRLDERIEIGRELCAVGEVVASWELEDLVKRARAGTWGAGAPDWC
jgi:hypothetical protein